MAKPVLFIVALPVEEEDELIGAEDENKDIEDHDEEEDCFVEMGEKRASEAGTDQSESFNLKLINRRKQILSSEGYQLKCRFEEIMKRRQIQGQCVWFQNQDRTTWKVMFEIGGDKIDCLLNDFMTAGIGNNDYSSISVIPINIHYPAAVEKDETKELDHFRQTVKSRMSVTQVATSLKDGSRLTFDYIALLTLASFMSVIGLVDSTNSVLLISGMLLSPLMGPILGVTFGIVIQDKTLWKPALKNEVVSLGICLLIGFVSGLVVYTTGIADDLTDEMISKGAIRSLILGVMVAFITGSAAALSILNGNLKSLIGVALSAPLLIPAVNAGMLCGYTAVKGGEHSQLVWVSLLLPIINIIIIFIMGVLVMKLKEIAPRTAIAVTKDFWKKDLKETREMLHNHHGQKNPFEESIIMEWSRLNNFDLTNKQTIKGRQGQRMLRELQAIVEGVEQDHEFEAVSNRLAMKPGSRLNQMRKIIDASSAGGATSRFKVKKVSSVEVVPREVGYVSRFQTTRYQEVDLSKRQVESIRCMCQSHCNGESKYNTIDSPSTQRINGTLFNDIRAMNKRSQSDPLMLV